MREVPVYNISGEEIEKLELNKDCWDREENVVLLHQAVTTYLSNLRRGTAATKTRAEARGGGRKPWRQKGTGRARHGSIRSPIWKGGGVTFGPNKRNYKKRMTKTMKKVALISALVDRMKSGKIKVIDKLTVLDKPNTKKMINIFKILNLRYPLLVIHDEENKDVNLKKSLNNIPEVNLTYVKSLNPYIILKAKQLLITSKAIREIERTFE